MERPSQLPKPLPEDQQLIICHLEISRAPESSLHSEQAMLLAHFIKLSSQIPSCFFVAIVTETMLMLVLLGQPGAFLQSVYPTQHSLSIKYSLCWVWKPLS